MSQKVNILMKTKIDINLNRYKEDIKIYFSLWIEEYYKSFLSAMILLCVRIK